MGLGVSFFSGGWVVTGGLNWLSRGREVLQAMNKAMEGQIRFVTCMAAPCMPMSDQVVAPTQQLAPLLRENLTPPGAFAKEPTICESGNRLNCLATTTTFSSPGLREA